MATIEKLKQFGVDEIACLIDFRVAADDVLASLPYLDELRRMSNPSVTRSRTSRFWIFLRRFVATA
jgi:hypothetical protein